jgi:hypothetical protein
VDCETSAFTTSDTQGFYRFLGRQATGNNQWYYVLYENAPDSTKIAYWASDNLTGYSAGAPHYGGSFDAADIALSVPPSPTSDRLPITFTWDRRSVTPADLYDWELYTEDYVLVRAIVLGLTGNSLALSTLPSGAAYDTPYLWGVSANNAHGSAASYALRRITFLSPSATATSAAAGGAMVPRWTFLTKESLDLMQYARFTGQR